MTTRYLIAIVAAAGFPFFALHAEPEVPTNFMPNEPQKTSPEAHSSDSIVKYTLLMPGEKSSEAVKEEERNPFGKSEDETRDIGGKGSSEETKIQEQLSKLHATGISPGPNGLRVLFGDMWLSKNEVMPPVVKDQTLALRVNDITREAIQLVWMEKKFTGLPPRLLVIPVDLRPTVRRVPHGQVPDKAEGKPESKASKRATAVEIPLAVAAKNHSESDDDSPKISQSNPAPPSQPAAPITPASPNTPAPAAKESAIVASSPPAEKTAPISTPTASSSPDPAVAQTAPLKTGTPALAAQPAAAPAKSNPAEPASEPSSWKRALGLMEKLVKPAEPAREPSSWKHAMGLTENPVKLSEANK